MKGVMGSFCYHGEHHGSPLLGRTQTVHVQCCFSSCYCYVQERVEDMVIDKETTAQTDISLSVDFPLLVLIRLA